MSLSANTTPENLLPTRCPPSRDCGLTKIKASRRIADRNTDHKPVNRIPGAIREIGPFVDEHLRIGTMFQQVCQGTNSYGSRVSRIPVNSPSMAAPHCWDHTLWLSQSHEVIAFINSPPSFPNV